MLGPYFSKNGALLPIEEATVSLEDTNYAYGYGVYETLRARHGTPFFADLHEERLYHSAELIDLEHPFGRGQVDRYVREIVDANRVEDANIKILLIGDPGPAGEENAQLYIMTLKPLFPDRKLYRNGARAITFPGERLYPQSKSLSMMVSTLAFGKARRADAYDALLVDREGYVTEGTRTNLYYTDGTAIYTPPRDRVLAGVTKLTLERLLKREEIPVLERPLLARELPTWSGHFLTSTSSKVMPLRAIDDSDFAIPELVRQVMQLYDRYLNDYRAGNVDAG